MFISTTTHLLLRMPQSISIHILGFSFYAKAKAKGSMNGSFEMRIITIKKWEGGL